MESDSGKRAKGSGVRNRRYSVRHPFAADAEMLELESGSRVSGVTSDLSLGGCFVCARRTLEIGARVRGTLTHESQEVKMLAVIRVVKARWEWASNFWTLIQTPTQHCWPGSIIFANRTERLPSYREVCTT
jgi:hypothetical protein